MTIGEKIKNEIYCQGRNMREVALKAGVPYNTLYAICTRNSTNRVNNETIIKIFRELGKSAESFGVDIPNQPQIYTIWKDNWPIGEINLYTWQADQANTRNREVYFAPKKEAEE